MVPGCSYNSGIGQVLIDRFWTKKYPVWNWAKVSVSNGRRTKTYIGLTFMATSLLLVEGDVKWQKTSLNEGTASAQSAFNQLG
jgi:hypothetical protein